jgi:hypothetical protein
VLIASRGSGVIIGESRLMARLGRDASTVALRAVWVQVEIIHVGVDLHIYIGIVRWLRGVRLQDPCLRLGPKKVLCRLLVVLQVTRSAFDFVLTLILLPLLMKHGFKALRIRPLVALALGAAGMLRVAQLGGAGLQTSLRSVLLGLV